MLGSAGVSFSTKERASWPGKAGRKRDKTFWHDWGALGKRGKFDLVFMEEIEGRFGKNQAVLN
jgi:hypothetical protein